MGITIKDIARMSNVSIATVSRVINNKAEGIGDETRRKVLELVKELNYQPNSIARGLVTKKTNTIGLIIPDISNPFFPDIARGVEDAANKLGYNVFLCNSDNNNDKERDYIKVLKEKYVDGIIFTGSSISNCSYILDLVDSSIPVVIMDRDLESENINGVFLDNYEGGYAATKHLIDLGHTGIGCAIGPLTTKSARDRLEGYMNALRDNGIQVDNHLIREGEYNIKGGEEGAKKILENKGVTAIFASNDLMAYGVYKTVHSKGLKIPEDISVVGFDDIQFSQILEPQLTTINQPTYDMGVTATQILLKLIQGKTVRKKMVNFKPKLIVRKSTKKL